jgi:hypothetical protein
MLIIIAPDFSPFLGETFFLFFWGGLEMGKFSAFSRMPQAQRRHEEVKTVLRGDTAP